MAIPSRQIGWSAKANLLWEISKQLELLTQVMGNVTCPECTSTTTTTTTISSASYLLTENNDELITENNDFIILN